MLSSWSKTGKMEITIVHHQYSGIELVISIFHMIYLILDWIKKDCWPFVEVYILLSGLLVLVCYHSMHTAGYTLNQKGHEREEQISCETSVHRQKIQIWYKLTSSTESPFYCTSPPLRQKMVAHCAASFFPSLPFYSSLLPTLAMPRLSCLSACATQSLWRHSCLHIRRPRGSMKY